MFENTGKSGFGGAGYAESVGKGAVSESPSDKATSEVLDEMCNVDVSCEECGYSRPCSMYHQERG